jgi:predicted acetyltransferase
MPLHRLVPADVDAVARRAELSFGPDRDDAVDRYARRIDAGSLWGWSADDGGPVLAHATLTVVDHWFGGRRVPCQHVAGVAVPPEHRGRGVARGLMEDALQIGVEQGTGLSLLFPATTRLYRSLGYEHAGRLVRYRVDTRGVPPVGAPLRPATQDDREAIIACAERANALHNGPAVRPAERWEQLADAAFWYVLDGADGLEGYVLVDHQRDPGDWQYRLLVRDWAATTARGLSAVGGFVGRHGTIGTEATFTGPAPDTWSQLVPEQDVEETGGLWWMARGLDLPAAVAARGFPPGLEAEVTFAVDDPLLPAARGPWRLAVLDGKGSLAPAEDAELRLDVRAFGPLFTGFRSAAELRLAGLLDGPGDAAARLGAAFAGSPPYLMDFF